MSVWQGILAESRAAGTLAAASFVLVAAALVRFAPAGRPRRVAVPLGLLATHAALVVAAGLLLATAAPGYPWLHFPGVAAGLLAIVLAAAGLLFTVLLPRLRLEVPRILQDLAVAGAAIVVIITVASEGGLNLTGIVATSAVITAIVAFALQDTLGNVMGGIALQLDDSIRVGDWIKLGDLNGRVSDIRWRYTALETRNWETVLVPNGVLMKGQVIVLGRRQGYPLQWRRWIYFSVASERRPSEVIAAVLEAVRGAPIEKVASEPPPNCILMDLAEGSARYAIRYWLTDLAADDPTDSAVRERVHFALARAGIPLRVPVQDVHVTQDSSELRAENARASLAARMQALAEVDLLAHLSEVDRAYLAEGLRHAPFARGEVLTHQGAAAHWLYIITRGTVSVDVAGEAGVEHEIAQLGEGQFFGEISLMTGAPRAATVVALTDVDCWRLDKATFQDFLRRRPELAEGFAEILARRKLELEELKETLDHEARARRLAADKSHFLGRIRQFFGLEAPEASPR